MVKKLNDTTIQSTIGASEPTQKPKKKEYDSKRNNHKNGMNKNHSKKLAKSKDVDDDNEDEIQDMIRTMCGVAFQKDFINDKLSKSKSQSQMMNENYDFVHNDYQHVYHEFKGPNIKIEDGSSNCIRSDIDLNVSLPYKFKVESLTNHHLKSLHRTEVLMKAKFEKAKTSISDRIKVLQLHYHDLSKRERIYFDELNDCRKQILTESQDHLKFQIQMENGLEKKHI